MRNHTKRLLVHVAMAFAAAFVSVAAPSRAEAAKCEAYCTHGACRTSALFKKVYCYCVDGYPVCGNKAPGLVSEPVEVSASSDAKIVASEEQILDLEALIERAYSLDLLELGDTTSRLYEVLVDGDARAYPDAIRDYEAALSSLSDQDWERLETGAR